MDSKLKLRRKVPDKNDMQNLGGGGGAQRERERERKREKKKGAHSMFALNDYGQQSRSRQLKYARKSMS